MIRKFLFWLLPIFLLTPGFVRADTASPDALVKNVTEEVLTILRTDKSIHDNPQHAAALIEDKVAPHFNFERMTSLAVGRAWQRANEGQRVALIQEFRNLLVRTYANSLTAYRDQTVTFKPSAKAASGGDVTVHSQINKPGAPPVPLDYSLEQLQGEWKVFDVAVANISLVTNYRNSFASEVEKGGIPGLLKALQEKNRRREAKAPSSA